MPLYEYKCEECGNVLEVIQRFSDDPMDKCPKCGGAMSKLISNTSFVLKGGGWYADGYAGKKADAAPASSSPTETKTESKPASDAKPKESASAS